MDEDKSLAEIVLLWDLFQLMLGELLLIQLDFVH